VATRAERAVCFVGMRDWSGTARAGTHPNGRAGGRIGKILAGEREAVANARSRRYLEMVSNSSDWRKIQRASDGQAPGLF
jgi:hypothetical protein